jgi:LytS/YehU family sensor histidine kinase
MLFGAAGRIFQGSLAMSIYAYWRVTQRAMRQAQKAETERVRNEQRVQTAKLLALQSRVEPQMLFDALGRIGALHVREPQAADALLADLIALLRAMLPGARADNSTVEREFALVDAWLRVARDAAHGAARVQLRIAPGAQSIGMAPMLVLPLLRTVLALPNAAQCEWTLTAEAAGGRLIVTLANSDAGAEAADLLANTDLSSLHDRLTQLFGRFARLTVSGRPPALALDLPRLQEDPDDDGPDR